MGNPTLDPDIPRLYSLAEAAAVLGYGSKQGLHKRIQAGEIPCRYVGTTLVLRADLIDALAAQENPATE
ncbi:helix-turn-helix domain-containing protein [Micromonospora chalcea]